MVMHFTKFPPRPRERVTGDEGLEFQRYEHNQLDRYPSAKGGVFHPSSLHFSTLR